MQGDPIPDKDHIVRWCSGGTIQDEEVEGRAFRIKFKELLGNWEEYLSVNWLEFFKEKENQREQIEEVCNALERKGFTVRATSGFAVLNVGDVSNCSGVERRITLSVTHEPELPNDPSHSGIRGYSPLDSEVDKATMIMVADLIAQRVRCVVRARQFL